MRLLLQNISTPIITAKLVQDDSKTSARVVKAKIEKTTLGQVRKFSGKSKMNEKNRRVIVLDLRNIRVVLTISHFNYLGNVQLRTFLAKHALGVLFIFLFTARVG